MFVFHRKAAFRGVLFATRHINACPLFQVKVFEGVYHIDIVVGDCETMDPVGKIGDVGT